jgi:two-component system, OmpR family, alkaline phosphatase synthesis response regulator PhoP
MKTILIVEDETLLAELLGDVFAAEGYNVALAADGRQGLAQVEEARPDLVLTDIMMPGMDGLTMCRTMQANPVYRSIPVVLMSAAPLRVSREDCIYEAIIGKPFDLDVLLEVVNGVLETDRGQVKRKG